jgi:clan AA aspartic protease (TIGR02281 family)
MNVVRVTVGPSVLGIMRSRIDGSLTRTGNSMKHATLAILILIAFNSPLAGQTRPTTRGTGGAPASVELEAVEAQLKAQGLTRVGITYLLDVDARIAEHLKPSRQAKKQLDDYVRHRASVAASIRKADEQVAQWVREYGALNDQLTRTNAPRAHNQLVGQINALAAKVKEAERYKTQREKELANIPAPREDYGALVAELAEKLELADKRYAELAKSAEVAAALAKLSEKGPKFRLGPSPGFTQTLKDTRRVRDRTKSSVIRLSMDQGVPHVDVTLNGSVTRAMVVDSGAGLVSLTHEVAQRLGLKPGPDDPVVKLVTADGKTTEGRLMTLDTVKVGQFVVEDVQCAILPADVPADVCLLGGTFLQNFIYRMDLASGQLHLTQVAGKPKDQQREDDALAGNDTAAAAPATQPAMANLLDTMKGNTDRKRNGAIVVQGAERILTAKSYAPPVAFTIVARAEKNSLRLAHAAEYIIFNWEDNPDHLRIDGGPAAGRHEEGAGRIPTDDWVTIELKVLPNEMVITVDGAERYRAKADFSKVKAPLSLFTYRDGRFVVKSVSVAEKP